ncbi:MAG: extracellular solute-binding protein, partial [candidate division Zixibacteria bacterium]|nr:extracellular solute-binding protein [candidate division Zixibacteria bacterium]
FFASGISINADSKHKEAAWLFTQWATSTAVQKEIVKTGQRSDYTVESVLGSPEFKKNVRAADTILEAARVADPSYFPRIPEFGQLADVFCAAVSTAVAKGPESVPGLMKEANAEVTKIMKNAGYYQ